MRRTAIALVVVTIVAVAIARRERRAPPGGARDSTKARAAERGAWPPAAATVTVSAPAAEVRPASLAGTDVDGQLDVDDAGRFRASAGAVRMFDYFLATLGETDPDGVRALVRAEAARQLPGQEDAVLALFDRYFAYLERLQADRSPPPPDVTTPRAYLERTAALQRASFGDELATRLFGDDDAVAFAILDRADVLGRDDLPPEVVAVKLDEIEARLPAPVRAARARMRAPELVRAQVDELRRHGATAAEIWTLRAAQFGPDAADRLAELDRQRGVAPGD